MALVVSHVLNQGSGLARDFAVLSIVGPRVHILMTGGIKRTAIRRECYPVVELTLVSLIQQRCSARAEWIRGKSDA